MRLVIFMLFISFGALSQEIDTILYLRKLTTIEVGTNICEVNSIDEISFDKYPVKTSKSLFENFCDMYNNLYFIGEDKIVELIIMYDIKDGCSDNCRSNIGQGEMIK